MSVLAMCRGLRQPAAYSTDLGKAMGVDLPDPLCTVVVDRGKRVMDDGHITR